MLIETLSQSWQKARSTDATDTSFPSRVTTGTEPSGNGVIDCGTRGAFCQNSVRFIPYATAGDNDTFSIRLIAWSVLGNVAATLLWIPDILCELAVTVSTAVGVAGRVILDTERFADTLTIISGNDDVSISLVSPTGNVLAHATQDMEGAQKIEFTFDSTSAGATAMNAIYRFM